MAVADTKVPLFKDHFWHFQIKIKFRKKNHEAGHHLTTRCWFLLDYSLINQPSYCFRSTAIHPWNCDHIGRETCGLGGGFLYFLQTSQLFVAFFIDLFRLPFSDVSFPAMAISFKSFSIDGCGNKWWSFSATSLSDLHSTSHRTIWC